MGTEDGIEIPSPESLTAAMNGLKVLQKTEGHQADRGHSKIMTARPLLSNRY